jgi:hypothetical protein
LLNKGRSWTEFYKYVKRWRGKRENISAIRDSEDKLVTEPVEKANALSYYFASVFSSKRINTEIQSTDRDKHFVVNTNIIRKRLA